MLSNLKNPANDLPPLEFPKMDDASRMWRSLPYQERIAKIRHVCEIRKKQLEMPKYRTA